MVDLIQTFLGFMLGLVSGTLGQYFLFKYSLKVEKIKRLAPHLETAM
jgi:hypothetical protein